MAVKDKNALIADLTKALNKNLVNMQYNNTSRQYNYTSNPQ